MTRTLRPRPSLAVAPAFVSQLNCLPLLGVDARRFLELVVPACQPHVTNVGKLRLVEVERAVEALRMLTVSTDAEQPLEDANDDRDQPRTAAAVLAKLGMELVP